MTARLVLLVSLPLILTGAPADIGAPRPEHSMRAMTRVRASPRFVYTLAGCAAVRVDGTCELDPGRALVVWSDEAELRPFTDMGMPVAITERAAVQDGFRLQLRLPSGATELRLQGASGGARVVLAEPTYPQRLSALSALRTPARLSQLAARLDALEREAQTPLARARLCVWRARLAYSRGQPREVVPLYRAALPVLLAQGRLSEAAAAAFALSYSLSEQLQRYDEAREVLAWIAPHVSSPSSYHEGQVLLDYHRTLLSMRTGQLAQAYDLSLRATRSAERLDMTTVVAYAWQVRALVESHLGRHAAARRTIERAIALSTTRCERAKAYNNRAWLALRAWEFAGTSAEGIRQTLEQALALSRDGCASPHEVANIEINLARLALLEHDLSAARAHLARARAMHQPDDDKVVLAELDVRGRIAIERGDFVGALGVYDRLSQRRVVADATRPNAELGRARALLGLGRRDAAMLALQRAIEHVFTQLSGLPVGMGRDSFSSDHAIPARMLVEVLLDLGRPAAALSVSRAVRTRHLSVLSALSWGRDAHIEQQLSAYWRGRASAVLRDRRAWARADDRNASDAVALASLIDVTPTAQANAPARLPTATGADAQDGTLVLAYFPRVGGFHGFASLAGELRHARIDGTPVDEASVDTSAWLAPFADLVARAERVRVIGGEGTAVELAHTLAFEGRPLIDHAAVAYALDVPDWHASAARGERPLYVIDPGLNLPGARQEGARLRALQASRSRPHFLQGREATHERLRETLGAASFFHFAGHARFDPEAWWHSGLALYGDERFTASDILALSQVPERVVLLACDTARAPDMNVATLGIAQAFLVRGARSVVASHGPVDDATGARFSALFHAAEGSVAERVRAAQLQLRARGDAWQGFRAMVP